MIKKTDTMNNEHLLSAINTYKNIKFKSVLQFARFLYDNYYEYLNIHDESGKKSFDKNATYTGAKNNDYRFAIDIVRKKITKDLAALDCRNSEYLYAYCICFGCSADYLLGFIELPTYADTDIYKKTGLEKDAINTLSVLKEFNKDYDQYRKPVELEVLNFIMKDFEKFREFVGYISALFIGADKAFYRDKEDKKWRFISDLIHVTYPTSKNSNGKQTANTGLLNIKSLAETDCIRHIELLLEDWKQEFKKK